MQSTPLNTDGKLKIIVADDHGILRAGLIKLVSDDPELKVVGEAGDGIELLQLLEKIICDMVILDISMPNLDGIKTLEKIKSLHPGIKVIMLTMYNLREYFKQAVKIGIDGYILKEEVYENLIAAIKKIQNGQKAYSEKITNSFIDNYAREQYDKNRVLNLLTKRDLQIRLTHSPVSGKIISAQIWVVSSCPAGVFFSS